MLFDALGLARRGGDGGPRFFFLLLLLLLFGFLIAKFVRHRRGDGGHRHPHGGSPIRTLEDRFARGEIDRDEFEHRKAVLDDADVIPPAPVTKAAPTPPPAPPAPPAPLASEAAASEPLTEPVESGDGETAPSAEADEEDEA